MQFFILVVPVVTVSITFSSYGNCNDHRPAAREELYHIGKQVKRFKMLTGGKAVRDRNKKIIQFAAFRKGEKKTAPGRKSAARLTRAWLFSHRPGPVRRKAHFARRLHTIRVSIYGLDQDFTPRDTGLRQIARTGWPVPIRLHIVKEEPFVPGETDHVVSAAGRPSTTRTTRKRLELEIRKSLLMLAFENVNAAKTKIWVGMEGFKFVVDQVRPCLLGIRNQSELLNGRHLDDRVRHGDRGMAFDASMILATIQLWPGPAWTRELTGKTGKDISKGDTPRVALL
ncbi:hypothetical protein BC827DRAFT_1153431 [Russula dissimulans]|nr:hypothetical protein BC827DRAFT_1153431 [Russula dissimulans]